MEQIDLAQVLREIYDSELSFSIAAPVWDAGIAVKIGDHENSVKAERTFRPEELDLITRWLADRPASRPENRARPRALSFALRFGFRLRQVPLLAALPWPLRADHAGILAHGEIAPAPLRRDGGAPAIA